MGKRKVLFLTIALFYIAYIIFPLFSDLTGIPVYVPSLVVFIGLIAMYPFAFQQTMFRWFVVYAVIAIAYVMIGKPLTIGIGTVEDSKKIIIEFAFILPSLSIYLVLKSLEDTRLKRIIGFCSLTMLVLSFLYIIPLMSISENILRDAESLELEEEITIPGLPGYGLMHAYTLLIPALCYGVRSKHGKYRFLMLLILAVYCFVVTRTSVTTSIVLMAFILVFSLFYSERNVISTAFTLGLLAFLVYLFYLADGFVLLIDWLSPFFEGTAVEPKIVDLKYSMTVGHIEGETFTNRQDLHQQSWDCFIQNPLFGTENVGGHSNVIDRLGGMGLIGAIPYFMIFVVYLKEIKVFFESQTAKVFSYLTFFIAFIYLYQKGNWSDSNWLFLLVIAPAVMQIFVKEEAFNEQNEEELNES